LKKMAKTKRRSCKGGRKSRRRSGGVPHENYLKRYKQGYHAGPEAHGFGKNPKGVSRLPETYSLNPFSGVSKMLPHPSTVDKWLLKAEMAPFRTQKALRRFGSAAANRLSSLGESARGLGASAMRKIGFHSGHLDHSKLQTVPPNRQTNYTMREGAADKLYYVAPNGGNLYTSSHPQGPVGYWPDRTDEMTAMFLPEHMPTESQTWMIVMQQ
jgi:hypothetical protein